LTHKSIQLDETSLFLLKSLFHIKGNVTIAGQTAPSPGITLIKGGISITVIVKKSRHVLFSRL
jgi:hypothetical protein